MRTSSGALLVSQSCLARAAEMRPSSLWLAGGSYEASEGGALRGRPFPLPLYPIGWVLAMLERRIAFAWSGQLPHYQLQLTVIIRNEGNQRNEVNGYCFCLYRELTNLSLA